MIRTHYEVSEADLRHLLLALDTLEAEVEQLVYDKEWYTSDSLDLLLSAKEILHSILGISNEEEEDDEDLQYSIELH
jgi:hypothetical protein